jgi:membrane protein
MTFNTDELIATGKALVKEIGADDVSGLAAELAYRMLLAIFPFFIFLVSLGAFVAGPAGIDNPTEEIMSQLRETLPSDAESVVERELSAVLESRNAGLLSFGVLAALWSASSAVATVMKALNRAYDVKETRPFLRRYATALGLTLLGGAFFVASFALLVIGQAAGTDLARSLGFGGAAAFLLGLLRFPLVVAMLAAAAAFLYWAAPNVKLPFRWVSPGSALFVAGWVVSTFAFSLYVANFGAYNATYGALAGVVVLLIWLYISAFVFLAGAELNALLHARRAPETLERPAEARLGGRVEALQAGDRRAR